MVAVKQEIRRRPLTSTSNPSSPVVVIADELLCDSVSSTGKRPNFSDDDKGLDVANSNKRPKLACPTNKEDDLVVVQQQEQDQNNCRDVVLPVGFLDPLTPLEREKMSSTLVPVNRGSRQFWKAGDYDPIAPHHHNSSYSGGMDHARVHPKFLHSNATSHKWALGAFAELLDNALDEVSNGATYVNVDMLMNDKDGSKMLLVQDNGGGMNPDKMRQCMSLGYSSKSKLANTIGQYGNGFKTSTMRLGADVIVFSCCEGKDGRSPTKSVGMLSYTFLQSTGKEDIVVPMIDYEKNGQAWTKMLRSSSDDWYRNLDTIIEWSPCSDEQELLKQFDSIENQGTRIIIYNLWEDDMGQLELDFDTDPEDIQIRGVNRDEKKIAMARKYPNSRHFLTYQHSLRSYTSILYLRIPSGFRIILRGKEVEHHNLANDMMLKKETLYKPKIIIEGAKDPDISPATIQALVAMGFAKDAQDHIDIQGFNVYHKNRLIRPFWRVWNAAGSDGRGVIGVLEANFVEPAHDKQGFERTTALARLEQRLIQMQKDYWRDHCHEVGYAPRRPVNRAATTASPAPIKSKTVKGTTPYNLDGNGIPRETPMRKAANKDQPSDSSSEDEMMTSNHLESQLPRDQFHTHSNVKTEKVSGNVHTELNSDIVVELRKKNLELQKRLQVATGSNNKLKRDLQFEKDRCKSFESKVEEANKKIEEMDKEQEALIQIFAEERERREAEEEDLRKNLQVASRTIQELVDKVKALEALKLPGCKTERY